jgi:hypothetical protein
MVPMADKGEPESAEVHPSLHTVLDAETQSRSEAARGRIVRRIAIGLMVMFIAAGVAGLFGYRQGSVASTAGSYRLTVDYPRLTRGGLASEWFLRFERLDGEALPPVLEVRSDSSYFVIFDENGFRPDPESTWQDGDQVVWTFEPPPGSSRLEVSFDARLQPNERGWRSGSTAVVIDDQPVASVDYTTVMFP